MARLDADQFRKIRQSPALFLAYCCVGKALRSQQLLKRGHPTIVVLIAERAMNLDIYEKAVEFFVNGRSPDWSETSTPKALVHSIESEPRSKTPTPGRKDLLRSYGKFPVILVLARHRKDLPVELSAAADAVIDLPQPSAAHIVAARALLGRNPIQAETAELLSGNDVVMLAPLLAKFRLTSEHARILRTPVPGTAADDAPQLDELPGYRDVKPWARSFASDLKRARTGEIAWADLDRGILLHGPPGTGKTLFARALAKMCGIPLIAASVAKWQAKGHLGDLLAAMRSTFQRARELQPAIVFLDELDSIGDRTKFSGHNVGYQTQVVNSLLECIDGVDGRQGIVVVAATNFPEAVDRALLRSGRIERHVRMDLPDAEERAEILRFHLGATDDDRELWRIAADLKAWSGSDLEKLSREARRLARAAGQPAGPVHVTEALPPLQTLPAQTARRIAVHESGHAVVALVLQPGCRASVSMRKQFRTFSSDAPVQGMTRYLDEPGDLETRDSMEAHICRILAGTAAEEVTFGTRSAGAGGGRGSDLHKATSIATRMVCSYGMGRSLSFLVEDDHPSMNWSGGVPAAARREIDGILAEQLSRAKSIVRSHLDAVGALARQLLERELVEPDDVQAILRRHARHRAKKRIAR
ncbi:AAA family ATPase [Rhizobium bangladeshense]|uniref:AAA family ATPase n=1 Tax=Rhizobium bangladeshense TaxID=1138189 RepID=UPI001A97D40F|nr:AAA family ATPase [Rhizobium bangladeshense]QSY95930.1 AAA family ATPase [Rhizobium bangladeshense]